MPSTTGPGLSSIDVSCKSTIALTVAAFAALLSIGSHDPHWAGRTITAYFAFTMVVCFALALIFSSLVALRWRRHWFRRSHLLLGIELLAAYALIWWGPRFGLGKRR